MTRLGPPSADEQMRCAGRDKCGNGAAAPVKAHGRCAVGSRRALTAHHDASVIGGHGGVGRDGQLGTLPA
ncbi:hypothetical protein, partial [Mycobacterium attenuatum]|uniref:hypothetical protein n=1 Tax=Mycobacterium attenuatum TaxID=2341086 RepID=UPI0010A973FC